MSWEQDQRIQRARRRKANRYLERFFHQMRAAGVVKPEVNKVALQKAVELVRAATTEQWRKLAKEMSEESGRIEEVPSSDTIAVIVSELEARIADVDRQKAQAAEDQELMRELFRQRGTGSVGAEVRNEEES